MQLCAGVVEKLKVAPGHTIEFGSCKVLLEGDREFSRLVNRQALLEEIATSLGEEPEETVQ